MTATCPSRPWKRARSKLRSAFVFVALLVSTACATPQPHWQPSPQPEAWSADRESTFFLQMADPQFGMWATSKLHLLLGWSGNPNSFERETVNMELAIAHANRLQPAFVVVCGDLVNLAGHAGQIAEFERIANGLDPNIPLHLVAGNHDVENTPTPDSLAAYRKTFGPDWYTFRHDGVFAIVLNSQLIHSPQRVPDAAAAQLEWLRGALSDARRAGEPHVLVFQHHPFFLKRPDEPDQYFNIPLERRTQYLELFAAAGVRAIFAGHYHRNAGGWAGGLEMVTTGPVGRPLGDDPSGFRIVRFGEHGLDHAYFALDAIPDRLGPDSDTP